MAAFRRRRAAQVREYALGYALVAPPVLFLALIMIYPALKAIWDTVAVEHVVVHHGVQSVERAFSLELYQQIWNDPLDRRSVLYTLQVTFTSIVCLFALCYPLAMYLRFSRGRIPTFFRTLSLIPLFIPTIIAAFAFISFYQQGNFLDVLLQNLHLESTVFGGRYPQLIDNTTGIVMAQVWKNIPITVLLISAGLGEIDNSLIESARDVGAGYVRIFRNILFPLTLRQALIALVLAFIGIMGSFNIPYLLGPTVPMMLGPLMQDNITFREVLLAQAEAVVTFVFALLVGLVYVVALARQRRR